MIKDKFFLVIILVSVFLNFKLYSKDSVYIAYKVDDEIITNIDIENEARYLIALNNQLKKLDNKKILEIAKDSILKETIKKIELVKYFTLDQTNPYLNTVIKDFYFKLKLNNEAEFKNYLKKYNFTIEGIKKKIEVETVWNELIYIKYKNQININKKALKKKIKNKKLTKNKKIFKLSEIIFEKKKDETLKKKIKKISESIEEIGFKNTATIYSISDSSKFGGDIGWIEGESLSNKIAIQIKNLKIGDYSKVIQLGSNFLVLKIEDIKNEIIKVDEEKELNKLIQFEKNRQLKQFSKIYYKKIKINRKIYEL